MSRNTSYTFQHKTISIADRLHPMVVKSADSGAKWPRYKSWLHLTMCCVTLSKLFNFSVPQCPHV